MGITKARVQNAQVSTSSTWIMYLIDIGTVGSGGVFISHIVYCILYSYGIYCNFRFDSLLITVMR